MTTSSLTSFIGSTPRDVTDTVVDDRRGDEDAEGWVGVDTAGGDSGWLCPLCYMMNPRSTTHCAVCYSAAGDSDTADPTPVPGPLAAPASGPVPGSACLAPHVIEFEAEALSAFGAPSVAAGAAMQSTGSLHAAVAAVMRSAAGGSEGGRSTAAPHPGGTKGPVGTSHPGSYVLWMLVVLMVLVLLVASNIAPRVFLPLLPSKQ